MATKKYFTEEERRAAQFAAIKRYQERNREKVQASRAAWREKNREKINSSMREYYEKNRERLRALKRAYYEKNRERLRALKRAYYERNREKINAKAREKKAAGKAGSEWRLEYKDFAKEAQQKPVFVNDRERLTEKQKAILKRIATAITADDIK